MKTRCSLAGPGWSGPLVALVMAALATSACASSGSGAGGDDAGTPTTGGAKTEEITASLGGSVEVASLTATVTEVQRRKTVGSVDAGYLVAQVTVANKSQTVQSYHRLQFQLRKPDGTSTNRTPIAGETQLGQGELQPGEQAQGQLIFTVEQAAGTFAVLFEPRQDDQPEHKRAVWTFESSPADAR